MTVPLVPLIARAGAWSGLIRALSPLVLLGAWGAVAMGVSLALVVGFSLRARILGNDVRSRLVIVCEKRYVGH